MSKLIYQDDQIIIRSNIDCWSVSYIGKGKKGCVTRTHYFASLDLLLHDLVETLYKHQGEKVKELRKLERVINKTHKYIEKILKEIKDDIK